MEIPFPGDRLGNFEVEFVNVQHHALGGGRYDYPVRMILRGKGGKQGARNSLREILGAKRTTFSGYGNPYQCWIDKVEIDSLGNQRYEVTARGIGVRIYLRKELGRFTRLLEAGGLTAGDPVRLQRFLDTYMEDYLQQITRTAASYRRKIQRIARTE